MRTRWAGLLVPAIVVPAILSAAGPAQAADTGGVTQTVASGITIPLPSPLPTVSLPIPTSLPVPVVGSAPSFSVQFPTETRSVPQMQAALLNDVNAERAAAGLKPLAPQPWAQAVALAHAEDMASARNIWHNYTGYLDVARQAIGAYVDGENVGMAGTLDELAADLLASPPHRYNILYPLYNYVGIGIARDADGYVYATEDFVDIRPRSAPVPANAPTRSPVAPLVAVTTPPPPAPAPPPAAPQVPGTVAPPRPSPGASSAPPSGLPALHTVAALRPQGAPSTHRAAAMTLGFLLALVAIARRLARRRSA